MMQVDGYSLDAQRDKLRKYAEYQDMVIAGEYSDEGHSGKNIKGRPEFTRMLADIESGKDDVKYVLVFKLSRFGRNASDVLNSLQLMQDYDVNLICVEDGIDSSKDSGKLMISVLSAVAEIERENIRVQTMAGREQKAREGKWNGGLAPYGYKLENGSLKIAEDEAEVIRIIFYRYVHTQDGLNGVAIYLNNHGYSKNLRQNNTISGFSYSFVKNVIDNPVYMGKIAFGRRKLEKKIGTRNEMHTVKQSDFPVYDGAHEALVSEEEWELAQEKRKNHSHTHKPVHNVNHANVLSGLLKCPCCGKGMYANTSKPGKKDNKTRYYYYCKNTSGTTGHRCTYRNSIEQSILDKQVSAVISAMVNRQDFKEAIKEKIGSAINTKELDKQLELLKEKQRKILGTKTHLEHLMDNLDVEDPHYDKKISDLQKRYDNQYDAMANIDEQIEDVKDKIKAIQQQNITSSNIYQLLLTFDELYDEFTEAEKKDFMRAFINKIEIYPEEPDDGCWIRKIVFNFPIPMHGESITSFPLESGKTAETCVLLSKGKWVRC